MEAILYDKSGNEVVRQRISQVQASLYFDEGNPLTKAEIFDAAFLSAMRIVPEPIGSPSRSPRRFNLIHVGEDAVYREA